MIRSFEHPNYVTISTKIYAVDTQKYRLDETVLLSCQKQMLKLIFCFLSYTVLYREKAFHYSILAFYYSILAFYYSILAFYNSILAFYYSILAFYYSILAFYNSVLAFYYSILAFNISRIDAILMAPKDMIRETLKFWALVSPRI